MTGVVLLRPLWLIGVLLAIAATVAALRCRCTIQGWDGLIAREFLDFLASRGDVLQPRRAGVAALVAAVAIVAGLALSGPATRNAEAPLFRNRDVIFLAVDLSRSMTEGGNLEDAKSAAALILAEAGARPVALSLFSGDAFLVSPPTFDPAALETTIAMLSAEMLPVQGSRPDRALVAARRTLAEANAEAADVILISDGGGAGPETEHAARVLSEEGNRVFAIFVGTPAPRYGVPSPSRDALERVVRSGRGTVVDADDTRAVAALARSSALRPRGDAEMATLIFDDHGRWILWLALVPAFLLFRRRKPA